jgi:putative transposase
MAFYEYRRLTPEEQRALVQSRIERGFPPHRPPHPERGAQHYLLTGTVFEHAAIIASDARKHAFQEALLQTFDQPDIEITAWVILPNHYHILAWLPELAIASALFNRLHGRTSVHWNREDQRQGRKVWYVYSDQAIRNEMHFYRAINYIHTNPVKHGYVQRSRDWRWSSLQYYMDHVGMDWLKSTWKRYPVSEFEEGWDK